MNYYGAFYKSALYCLLTRINAYLLRWVRNKYRRLRGRSQKAWIGVIQRHPRFFAHWAWINMPPLPDDQDDKSRVTLRYARIRGSRRVKPPPATRQGKRSCRNVGAQNSGVCRTWRQRPASYDGGQGHRQAGRFCAKDLNSWAGDGNRAHGQLAAGTDVSCC
jgi:hypothetical protein